MGTLHTRFLYNCDNYNYFWLDLGCKPNVWRVLEFYLVGDGYGGFTRYYQLHSWCFQPNSVSFSPVFSAMFVSVVSRLQILGHGQGMTTYYVMLDQHPSLAQKISLTTSMAPITYGAHTTGLLKLCSKFLISLPHWMTVGRSSRNLFPFLHFSPSKVHFCLPQVCWTPWQVSFVRRTPAPRPSAMTFSSPSQGKTKSLFTSVIQTWVRFDEEQQDKSDLTKQMQHFPAGTSARTIVHTAQNIQQGGWWETIIHRNECKYFINI